MYISLPLLQDYDVKLPHFTFNEGREHEKTIYLFFSELRYSPLEFNTRKIRQYSSIERDGIKAKKFKAVRIHFLFDLYCRHRRNGNNEYRERENEKWELKKQRMGCEVTDRAKV